MEVYYPDQDKPFRPERPLASIIDDVNHYLMANTKDGEKAFTFEGILEAAGIPKHKFGEMAKENETIVKSLELFLDINENGTFVEYGNRADVISLVSLAHEITKPKDD